jgi:hypothetical protein
MQEAPATRAVKSVFDHMSHKIYYGTITTTLNAVYRRALADTAQFYSDKQFDDHAVIGGLDMRRQLAP